MALLSWVLQKICHCREGKAQEKRAALQKAGEGGRELPQPVGEHLGLVPSPVQQLGDYKGQRELERSGILVFAASQGFAGLGSTWPLPEHGSCCRPRGGLGAASSCGGTLAWGGAVVRMGFL